MDKVLSYANIAPQLKNFVSNITSHVEPKTYTQIIHHEEWKKAMNKELYALEYNQTWTLVPLPHGKHPIGCKIGM